uniref:Uncharacterized protein n=1 Tax=Panagrolaimus superbus TaxID=310955 RepID=A0A914Y1X7_9BILA
MNSTTDDKGNLHIFDRATAKPVHKTRAHRLRKVGDLECPAWSCSFLNENSVVSVGDDGRLCLWDLRESNLKESLFIYGITEDGMVFVSSKDDTVIAVGDYAQNYCLYDLRSTDRKPMIITKFPGGVWHVDSSMENSKGLSAAACMQGGVIVFDSCATNYSGMDILAHDSDSSLTYGVAIHEDLNGSTMVAEVEFDSKKLNKYLLLNE